METQVPKLDTEAANKQSDGIKSSPMGPQNSCHDHGCDQTDQDERNFGCQHFNDFMNKI
jgi:hypothetical protein